MRQNVSNTIIVIPARMAATRLPGKPLRQIGDAPMIVQVWRRAVAADIGRVIVACDGDAIADIIRAEGGEAVITDPDLPSGSDRVAAALTRIDPDKSYEYVINLQGDLPEMTPEMLSQLNTALHQNAFDIITPVALLTAAEKEPDSVVKAVVSWPEGDIGQIGWAIYFSRAAIPHGGITDDIPMDTATTQMAAMWHHVGVYGWRRTALEQFVTLPPSALERAEKLEQLRAIEAGMRIGAIAVDMAITGIDTETDLQAATNRMATS
ncbi:MAG: 3-deoxy-manno-octulosonate cytidylyltransferase [Candidatus Puniceispirillales bacterium]